MVYPLARGIRDNTCPVNPFCHTYACLLFLAKSFLAFCKLPALSKYLFGCPLVLNCETLVLLMPPWHARVGQTEILKLQETRFLRKLENFDPLLKSINLQLSLVKLFPFLLPLLSNIDCNFNTHSIIVPFNFKLIPSPSGVKKKIKFFQKTLWPENSILCNEFPYDSHTAYRPSSLAKTGYD